MIVYCDIYSRVAILLAFMTCTPVLRVTLLQSYFLSILSRCTNVIVCIVYTNYVKLTFAL